MLAPMCLPSILLALVGAPTARATELPDIDLKLRSGQRSGADSAVVVGIEEYPFLPHVPYAARDADAFYSFLVYTRGVSPTRLSLLTQDPTAADIREAVRQRAAEVGAGGTLWVYFAGHGAADPETGRRLLLGVDVQPKVSSLTDAHTVAVDELASIASESSAAQVVLVVDACYTGTGRDGKALLEGKRFAVPTRVTTPPPKIATWTAASPAETSGPLDPAGHGLFTYFVVGALRGWADGEFDDRPDGTVTLEEASQFVRDAVRTVGGGEQNPVLEAGAPLLSAPLVRGTALEARPDIAELVRGTRPAGPEKPAAEVSVAEGGSFAEKLAELKRLQAERQAAEARERELADAVAAERARQVEAATGAIVAEASAAWTETVPLLELGGEEARLAAQLFVDTYGSVRVVVEGTAEVVKIPEVATARAWLAQQGGTPPAPAPVPDAVVVGVDPLAGIGTISDHPLWELPWASEKLAKKLGGKIRRDSWDDEAWGDAGDKAYERGDVELAAHFWLHALAIDPSDGEWGTKLTSVGTTGAVLAALADRLRADPSSDEVWGDLGDAYVAVEAPAEACASYLRAAGIEPTDGEWERKIGELGCGSMSAPTSSALAEARAAALAAPGDDERMGDWGDALMAAGQVAEACETYQRALDLDPTDSEWPGKLLGCLESDLVVDAAGTAPSADELRARVEATAGSDAGVAAILAGLDPEDDEQWGNLGDAVFATGSRDLAVEVYARAMRLDPVDREWQTRISELAGYDALFATFGQALAAEPANDEILGEYGDRLTDAGRREEACQAYRSAARFDSGDSEWADRVAECDGTSGAGAAVQGLATDDAGLAVLADQVGSDPQNDERWGDYADGLAERGRNTEACDAYARANTLDPSDSEWVAALDRYGCFATLAAAPESAEELDDEAIGDRGDELALQGDLAGACEAYAQALEIDSQDSEWGAKRIACLVTLSPGDDESLGDLGDRLASWGRMDLACAAYREALKIDRDDQEWKDRRADCRGVE